MGIQSSQLYTLRKCYPNCIKLECYILENPESGELKIKLSADGAQIGFVNNFINFTFTIINELEKSCSLDSNRKMYYRSASFKTKSGGKIDFIFDEFSSRA